MPLLHLAVEPAGKIALTTHSVTTRYERSAGSQPQRSAIGEKQEDDSERVRLPASLCQFLV